MTGAEAAAGPAKPGTACLGCRRRKLKCSREPEGCNNCTKVAFPCVYPQPETGLKRKRGPYRKDKPAHERHLEHLVKYLEPGNQSEPLTAAYDAPNDPQSLGVQTSSASVGIKDGASSEELVKDALIALTQSSLADQDSMMQPARLPFQRDDLSIPRNASNSMGQHPPASQVLTYWRIFLERVDPLTKLIHSPSFFSTIFIAATQPNALDPGSEILCFSIYYLSVSTCTAVEALKQFGDSRENLLHVYGQAIEAALSAHYETSKLEHIQAIILYMFGLRRQDEGWSMATLFGITVRMAQMMTLHEDPGTSYSPFEAEYRRRAWYHICALESRAAEELGEKSRSVMDARNVIFPANLNDIDLDPQMTESAKPRQGFTDVSWVLVRWEIQRVIYSIWRTRRDFEENSQSVNQEALSKAQYRALQEAKSRIRLERLQYLDRSRPLDLLALAHYDAIILKAQMMIDHPFGQIPTQQMNDQERFRLLQSSVAVISITHMVAIEPKLAKWNWFTRGYMQWHSLAIVVSELGRIRNKPFAHSAWAVLDPILADWDKLYGKRIGEAAWDHVHTLISRARQHAQQVVALQHPPSRTRCQRGHESDQSGAHTQQPVQARVQPIIRTPVLAFPQTPMQVPQLPEQPQQELTPNSIDDIGPVASQTLAPGVWDFPEGFGSFDGLDQIDFDAFDTVFGSEAWECQGEIPRS